jgi:hypothetical protein
MSRTGLLLVCLLAVAGCRGSSLTDPFLGANGHRVPPPQTGSVGVPGASDAYYSPNVTPTPGVRPPVTAPPRPYVPQSGAIPSAPPARWQQPGASTGTPQPYSGVANVTTGANGSGFRAPALPSGGAIGTGVRAPATSPSSAPAFVMRGMPVNDATLLSVAPRAATQPGQLADIGDPTRPIYSASISRSAANANQVARPTSPAPVTAPAAWAPAGAAPRTAGSPGPGVQRMSFNSPALPGVGNYHFSPDYAQVRGKLEYSAADRRWLLHYQDAKGTSVAGDRFGGVLPVSDSGKLDGYKPGDFVEISGRVAADASGDAYVVEQVARQSK